MDTNFHMIRTFEYNPKHFGVCNGDEVKQIEKHFKLNERSDVELQNLRDFVVLCYSEMSQKLREKDDKEYMKIYDTMSAITGVIDNHKWNRGMEVQMGSAIVFVMLIIFKGGKYE